MREREEESLARTSGKALASTKAGLFDGLQAHELSVMAETEAIEQALAVRDLGAL